MIKVKRALISVSDKTGLLEFARELSALGIEIISTGGTARLLKGSDVPVKEVSEVTQSPEILDGRVKTLHPSIHGSLLALRNNEDHMTQLHKQGIELIDMVVVNLYPFKKVIQKKKVTIEEALENIDIGGPSMIRSAAKNYKSVAVICNPSSYESILAELKNNSGLLSDTVLRNLAIEAFRHTSKYDSVIFDFLNTRLKSPALSKFPPVLNLPFRKVQDLRYGENPHQDAAFYRDDQNRQGLAKLKQLHGKELSFNNYLDLDAALQVIQDFDKPASVIIKHNNPTGVAEDTSLAKAYKKSWACDPLSAFGGIIGFNRKVDLETAKLIFKSGFMECIVAPGYAREAKQYLAQKKNLRILELKESYFQEQMPLNYKQIWGGLLVQEKDHKKAQVNDWRIVSKKKPTKTQMESFIFGWKVIKHIKSNAIILVKGTRTLGIGCGQTSRVESTMTAIKKAGKDLSSALLVSDAFIPKTDNILMAAKAGIKGVIQTGGSIADEEVIHQANKASMIMILTGVRHFKH